MYSKIVNPQTGRKVSINGRLGRNILKKYLTVLNGGSQRRGDLYELKPMPFAPPTEENAEVERRRAMEGITGPTAFPEFPSENDFVEANLSDEEWGAAVGRQSHVDVDVPCELLGYDDRVEALRTVESHLDDDTKIGTYVLVPTTAAFADDGAAQAFLSESDFVGDRGKTNAAPYVMVPPPTTPAFTEKYGAASPPSGGPPVPHFFG